MVLGFGALLPVAYAGIAMLLLAPLWGRRVFAFLLYPVLALLTGYYVSALVHCSEQGLPRAVARAREGACFAILVLPPRLFDSRSLGLRAYRAATLVAGAWPSRASALARRRLDARGHLQRLTEDDRYAAELLLQ
ncbi:MAG: hypothetical protein M3245_00285 [Actinomycetota bacterium]|nr:hypothetical protein [Actinomycetota bacterium]